MTTTLRNVTCDGEAKAFYAKVLPVNPLPFLYALADSVKEKGTHWIKTDYAKAILFTLIQMAYGQNFSISGTAEYERLRQLIEGND
jgi:hypothetical protein